MRNKNKSHRSEGQQTPLFRTHSHDGQTQNRKPHTFHHLNFYNAIVVVIPKSLFLGKKKGIMKGGGPLCVEIFFL